jgi:carbon storage regulator
MGALRHDANSLEFLNLLLRGERIMLVISRGVDEAVRIADTVRVKVLKLGQRRVTLGIEAPADVLVLRDELHAHQAPSVEAEPVLKKAA